MSHPSKVRAGVVAALVTSSSLFAASAMAGPIGYTLGDDGGSLVRFDAITGDVLSEVGIATAMGATTLDDIDFRPLTGDLFGYNGTNNTYYTVNLDTGLLSLVGSNPATETTDTSTLGFDFNPTIDRARTVTADDQNIVLNPNDGSTTRVTDLFYVDGDANAGEDANIVANGYTNSVADATTTVQFAIDSDLDTLATLANNTGELTTVGELGIDVDDLIGLDILTVDGLDSAFLLSGDSFYDIDLVTGAATLVSDIAPLTAAGPLRGLAIRDEVTAVSVPEPGILGLLTLGFGGLMLRTRRRFTNG